MKQLIIHEILKQLKSFKFFILLFVTILTVILTSYVQISDLENKQEIYNLELEKYKDWQENIRVFSELKIPYLVAPNPVAIFSNGVENVAGNKLIFSTDQILEFKKENTGNNPFLSIFRKLDITALCINVLSVLVLLLVADTISSEKEENTLKTIFSNPVSRSAYFFSKYIALSIIISIIVAIVFLIPLLFLVMSENISLTGTMYTRIALLFVSTLSYFSILIVIGLLISSLTSTTSYSTMAALFVWLFITIIYPSTTAYVVNMISTPPSEMEIATARKESYIGYCVKVHEWDRNNPIKKRIASYHVRRNEFFPSLVGVAPKEYFEFLEKKIKALMPIYLKASKELMEIEDQKKEVFHKRKVLIDRICYLLPGTYFQNGNEKIANTDFGFRERELLKKARYFRNVVLHNYLKDKDAIGLKYFTQFPRSEMKSDFYAYSKEVLQKYNPENYPRLELKDIPRFEYPYKVVIPLELFVAILYNVILLFTGLIIFSKYRL